MGISFTDPWVLLLLLPVTIYLLWVRLPWLRLARRASRPDYFRERWILGLRLIVAAVVIMALAGAQVYTGTNRQAVLFLMDGSASTTPARRAAEEWLTQALREKGPDDVAGVVVFGREARIETPPGETPVFGGLTVDPGRHATDLAVGLRLAGLSLPPGYRGRIVVLTDARENSGDAQAEVRRLAMQGIRVDWVPLEVDAAGEVMVTGISLPDVAYEGERTNLSVVVTASEDTAGKFLLFRDEVMVLEREVRLLRGDNQLVFSVDAGEPGLHRYRVVMQVDDGFAVNNEAGAFQRVLGRPRVLVVEGSQGAGEGLRRALRSAGIEPEVVLPGEAPLDLAGWGRYQAVFLADVPSRELSGDALTQLEVLVRDLGRGLVMVGGPQSFGLGGYFDTPVERALPLNMNLEGRGRIPPLSLLLVIDKSGSMGEAAWGGVDKMALAREGAVRAMRMLKPGDYVGVLAFDSLPKWVVGLQHPEDGEAIQQMIGTIRAGGGTNIYPALAEAYEALKHVPVLLKHVILLTDGRSAKGGGYQNLLEAMNEAEITVSTVAIGRDADVGLLEAIARRGKGRYYFTNDAASVPEIFAQETVMATRTYVVEGSFQPVITSSSALLQGLPEVVPPLDGYVATTPKGRAEVIMVSPLGDPILAAWQYGLGRAAAWTSDTIGRWSAAWSGSAAGGTLWRNILSWVLPADNAGGVRVAAQVDGNGVRITVEDAGNAEPAEARAVLLGPKGWNTTVQLKPEGPGTYAGRVQELEPGTYLIRVEQAERTGGRSEGEAGGPLAPDSAESDAAEVSSTRWEKRAEGGMVVPYSLEYRELGLDRAFLGRLVETSGGAVLSDPGEAFLDNLPPVRAVQDLWPWLLLFAIIMLPLDVGYRRLSLAGCQFPAASLPFLRPRKQEQVSTSQGVGKRGGSKGVAWRRVQGTAGPGPTREGDERPAEQVSDLEELTAESPASEEKETGPGSLARRLLEARRRGGKNPG